MICTRKATLKPVPAPATRDGWKAMPVPVTRVPAYGEICADGRQHSLLASSSRPCLAWEPGAGERCRLQGATAPRCRPAGAVGDRTRDGWRASERRRLEGGRTLDGRRTSWRRRLGGAGDKGGSAEIGVEGDADRRRRPDGGEDSGEMRMGARGPMFRYPIEVY